MSRYRLSDALKLHVVYGDESAFGGLPSGKFEDAVHARVPEIMALEREHGLARVVADSERLLEHAMRPGALGDLYARPGVLREACLYPDPRGIGVVALQLEHGDGNAGARVPVPAGVVAELARWIGAFQHGLSVPRGGPARALFDALLRAGAFVAEPAPVTRERAGQGDALFVGHACVRVGARPSSVLVDPFLLPRSPGLPEGYQPHTHGELAPDAICITHSHPDHFDLGTLLRFGPDIPIVVPEVARESILAIDMAARLRELGFARVHALGWHQQLDVGDTRITALPFHGEQPTAEEVLHPEVRNDGNLYLIETAGRAGERRRYAFSADAGADCAGDSRRVAGAARERLGEPDVLFGGYRAWALYPIRYLFSSVARYLLFVPRDQWHVRQQIMNDADDTLDVAERWGARRLVPYAAGGAPWHWQRGLGPRLDDEARHDPHFDPPPEAVQRAAAARTSGRRGAVPSPVRVRVLRPGEGLSLHGAGESVERSAGHVWPFGAAREAG